MNRKIIILLSIIAILNISCEQTVTNVELPYVEQLVIDCIMDSGDLVDSVIITKTLPPLAKWEIEKTIVTDAKVTISDGTKIYELNYQNNFYNSKDLIAESGKTYYLTVEWKGKKATATTFVPYPIEIPEIKWDVREASDFWGQWYEVTPYALVKPTKNVVYNSGYITTYHSGGYPTYFYIARETDINADGLIKIDFFNGYYTENADINYIKQYFKDYVFVLHSYDKQFYQFFITRYNGQSGDEIFGGNSNNIQWNIKGDGIGLFIGRATTYKKI